MSSTDVLHHVADEAVSRSPVAPVVVWAAAVMDVCLTERRTVAENAPVASNGRGRGCGVRRGVGVVVRETTDARVGVP